MGHDPVATSQGLLRRLTRALAGWPGVAVAYLFGSRARGTHRPASDVDVAVLVRPRLSARDAARTIADLAAKLDRAIPGVRVDLVVLNTAPLRLAVRVLVEGRLVACRDERARIAFQSRTMMDYYDQGPLLAEQDRLLMRRIEEGSFGRRYGDGPRQAPAARATARGARRRS